ncbi:MAG: right-handed parallel beta-helix repeat-containing protein [Prevotellaceae bacterium]|nr:right-handed parallel beta-helix repeat-containing protein [Prevotellaceae bacterium]
MKKLLSIFLLGMLLAFTACQKDEFADERTNEKELTVRFTADLPLKAGDIKTKASDPTASSADGAVKNVDFDKYDLRYILEIYTTDNPPARAERIVKTVGTPGPVTIETRLIPAEYDFVFWADITDGANPGADLHYTTGGNDGLQGISIIHNPDYIGNDDSRDAYTHVERIDVNSTIDKSIILKRPFGKVRVIALDVLDKLSITLKEVKVAYKNDIPSGFNALKNELIATELISEADAKYAGTVYNDNINGEQTISWDYIFAPVDGTQQQGHNFDIAVYDNQDKLLKTRVLNNIPIQRNKLTTVKGNFLTEGARFIINVDDAFDDPDNSNNGDLNIVASVSELNGVLARALLAGKVGNLHFVFEGAFDATANDAEVTFGILDKTKVPRIRISFKNGMSSALKLGDDYDGILELAATTDGVDMAVEADAGKYTGAVLIGDPYAPKNLNNLDVNLPDSHVTFYDNAATATVVSANSSFVVAKGAAIGALTVNGGGVNIYGTVSGLTNNGTGKIMLAIGPKSDRPISGTVVRDALAVSYADGLIFTEGNYPLNYNVQGPGQVYYMPITKAGYKIIGEGKVIVYGNEEKPNNSHGMQNLVTIFADNVEIKGITFMPKKDINKTLEVDTGADNFKMSECIFVPNTIKGYGDNAGSVYIGGDNSEITGNTFTYSGVFVDANISAAIMGNTFNYGSAHYSWANACVRVRGEATVERNIFNFIQPVSINNYPIWAENNGVVRINTNTYPDINEIYWTASDNGQIILNGNSISYTNPSELLAQLASAGDGDVFNLKANDYDIGTGVEIDKSITIQGNGAKIASKSPTNRLTPSYHGKNPILYITSTGTVTLKNIVFSTNETPGTAGVDGITVDGNGKLVLENVVFDGILNVGGFSGAQHGRCVTVFGAAELEATNCTFKNFNKNGIHMFASSKATINNCTFIGNGIRDISAQNGIVFMRNTPNDAYGSVSNSSFSNFICKGNVYPNDACAVMIYDDNSIDNTNPAVTGINNTYNNNDANWYEGI